MLKSDCRLNICILLHALIAMCLPLVGLLHICYNSNDFLVGYLFVNFREMSIYMYAVGVCLDIALSIAPLQTCSLK